MSYNTPNDMFLIENLPHPKPFRAYMASGYDWEGGNYV